MYNLLLFSARVSEQALNAVSPAAAAKYHVGTPAGKSKCSHLRSDASKNDSLSEICHFLSRAAQKARGETEINL